MSDYKHEYWREAIEATLGEVDLVATPEQLESIAKSLEAYVENMDLAFGRPESSAMRPSYDDMVRKVASLDRDLKDSQQEVACYRRSVAIRRNVPISDVHLENGEVIYGTR